MDRRGTIEVRKPVLQGVVMSLMKKKQTAKVETGGVSVLSSYVLYGFRNRQVSNSKKFHSSS